MKIALVYDRVNKWGGAERVLLALHELFPEAPLYTSVYHPGKAPWAKVFPKIIPSFINQIPGSQGRHELFPFFMPTAFESMDFSDYDLVVSVTSEAAKGIQTHGKTKHICYCLTPTRYLWSHYNEYFKGYSFKGVTKPIVDYLRKWDKVAAQRADKMIAISKAVQKRIEKYYGRTSKIIFPPVETELFKKNKLSGEYYLVVSRLVPYKKVDLAVETFNQLGLPLIVVGKGSEESKLKSKSKKNIKFVGQVSDEKLVKLYTHAIALIMPQEEDFGISAVEAMASGVPVIAYQKGGALDTVVDGKTGLFFKKQTVKSLSKAVKNYHTLMHDNLRVEDCVKQAAKFSKERFKKEFSDLIFTKR